MITFDEEMQKLPAERRARIEAKTQELLNQVNALDVGLTAAIYTTNLSAAHRFASRIEAGYIWINHSAQHFLGTPFGGYKMSGVGREESIEELLSFTRQKNVYLHY